jgi:YD repeat-containing protein
MWDAIYHGILHWTTEREAIENRQKKVQIIIETHTIIHHCDSRRAGLAREGWTTFFWLFVFLILGYPTSSRAQSPTVYVYDPLGRLIGVVNPATETAVYTYDANGNILSISRHSSSQIFVIGFTPNNGTASTTVRIFGTGFSGTATQDTVRFNGVQATIKSASATEIVTSVPNGATTGPINVTAPGGSVSSTTPFTIGPSKSPTITGFTPNIGSRGAAVGITGTNFQTMPASDAVRFNLTLSQVTSATALNIKTRVPTGATSGHISLATPFGNATSTADFFAPPPPYTAADVAFTGRMSTKETSTLTIGTTGKIGLMLFDEPSSHRLSLVASNVTFGCVTLSILSPSSVTLGSNNNVCNGVSTLVDTPTLSEDGTYTILAQPTIGTGSVDITLYDVAHDFTSSITPNGPPVDVKLTTPGQNAQLTFSGTKAEKVSLNFSNSTFPTCSPNLSIVNPDGSVLDSQTCIGLEGFVAAQTLPTTGAYRILLTTSDPNTGSMVANLYKVVDVTGSIAVNGSTVTVSLTTPGQTGALTFGGNSNQQITVHVTNNTITCVTLGIVKPDGTLLFSELECGSTFDLPTQVLPTRGTYKLSIVPNQAETGSLKLKITSP